MFSYTPLDISSEQSEHGLRKEPALKELLQVTSRWMELEYSHVTIETARNWNPHQSKDLMAKSIGDGHLRLFQLKIVANRWYFPLEPGCRIHDGEDEYLCMLIFIPDYPHHPFVLARPKRPEDWSIIRPGAFGSNPFVRYGGWFSLPSSPVEITSLVSRQGKNISMVIEARSYDLDCYRIFQIEQTIPIIWKNHITLVPGCTISDSSGSYKCLMVMDTGIPHIPVVITEKN